MIQAQNYYLSKTGLNVIKNQQNNVTVRCFVRTFFVQMAVVKSEYFMHTTTFSMILKCSLSSHIYSCRQNHLQMSQTRLLSKYKRGTTTARSRMRPPVCVSQPVTTDMTTHPSTSDMRHQKQNSLNCSALSPELYSASTVNQEVNQPVSKIQDQEGHMPEVHAPFCMTSKQLQPCKPKMWPCQEDTGEPGHTCWLLHCCQTQAAALPHAAASFGLKRTSLIS